MLGNGGDSVVKDDNLIFRFWKSFNWILFVLKIWKIIEEIVFNFRFRFIYIKMYKKKFFYFVFWVRLEKGGKFNKIEIIFIFGLVIV